MATWNDIRRVALGFPGVEEVGDPPSWRVRAGGLAWERPLRKSDLAALGDAAPTGPILGIRTVDLASKEEAIAAAPGVFFVTPHFDGYPAVLARLGPLDVAVFEALFAEIWAARAPKKLVRARLLGS